ncbi:MAG TPA: GreA/GreB family elongation factor [Gaiellaceae bacterium]
MSRQPPTARPVRPARDGEAEVGERVTVLDLDTSAVHDYRLVEPDGDHVADGKTSIRAPLGSALLGRHVGDVVSVQDGDHVSRLEVVEIDG